MPLDTTHFHTSDQIVRADDPHTPIDPNGGGGVASVNGQTGVVVLDADDVGAVAQGVQGATGVDGSGVTFDGGSGDAGNGGTGAIVGAGGGGGTGQGGDLNLLGGSASAGRGGDVTIEGGFGNGGRDGQVFMDTLPTTDPSTGGAVWDDDGHLALSGATPLADMFDGRTADFVANGSTVDQLRDALIAAGLMAAS